MGARTYRLVGAVCTLALTVAPATSASRSASPARTPAAYRAQANAICATESRAIEALGSHSTLAAYLTNAVRIAHTAFEAMKKDAPPSGLAQLNARVLTNIAAGFPIISGLIDRAKVGDLTLTQFEHDKALTANVVEEDSLWKQLGATICASS